LRDVNAAYYDRHYRDPRTRAVSRAEMDRRGRLIAAQLKALDVPVKRILDAGCGLGLLQRSLLEAYPRARYTGLEVSAYLCRRLGWIQGSIVDFKPRGSFDLVICHDVVQYLDDAAASAALDNLARWCRGALYFHVPTARDRREIVDPEGTDTRVHFRPGSWYQRRLRRHFTHTGIGVHVPREASVSQWELEEPWR
jgi:2-polyprenyl-3-methyl-5-hydroxy-6-metoxy-1,4-benzoquinol methylase